jgi:hypothetical protein
MYKATPLQSILGRAAREFSQCARTLKARSASSGTTAPETEKLIGLGIAIDWARWAQHLVKIKHSIRKPSTREKEDGLTELTRFTFMWTATNALFARSAIIGTLDRSAASERTELARFRVLYEHSGILPAEVTKLESVLHSLLAEQTHVQHFPWARLHSTPTVLELIFFKYTVLDYQRRGIGPALHQAVTSGNYTHLDLPTLIYATRNWNIHGVILSSSFRGPRQRFLSWINTTNMALARVLEGTATALSKKM